MNRKLGVACVFVGLTALCTISGCGDSGPRAVSGKVTKDGTPLTSGSLAFHSSDGKKAVTGIGGDGSYTLADPPTGSVTVTVEVTETKLVAGASKPRPEDKLKMIGAGSSVVSIPPKYKSKATSDLIFTLTGSGQTLNIELK